MPYQVSDGAIGAFDVFLEQSGIPIPEFPVAAIVLASALASSLVILSAEGSKPQVPLNGPKPPPF